MPSGNSCVLVLHPCDNLAESVTQYTSKQKAWLLLEKILVGSHMITVLIYKKANIGEV